MIWNKKRYLTTKISEFCLTNEHVFRSYTHRKYWITNFQIKKEGAINRSYFTPKDATPSLPTSTEALRNRLGLKITSESCLWLIHFHNVPSYWVHGWGKALKHRNSLFLHPCLCIHIMQTDRGRMTEWEGRVSRANLYKYAIVKS